VNRFFGRTQRRVILAILVTAVVPLLAAMMLADVYIKRLSETAFQPEFSEHLERALGVYADLVKSMKQSMRNETDAMAADHALRGAARKGEGQAVERALERAMSGRPHLARLAVQDAEGELLAERRRAQPIDPTTERPFKVQRPLGEGPEAPLLVADFGADRTRLDEMAAAQEFAQAYRDFAHRHRAQWIDQTYVRVFAVLFGLTVLLAVITGILVVRPVTRRINRLAAATRPVAEGDLSVRVDDRGRDEIADLGGAFNQMLKALSKSQARIAFLTRISEWQTMARRLAHEIKNPLTPIQLAVEECHRRYADSDEGYRELLRTTVDIVTEEVAGLRRLVGEFAEFARLPRARLQTGDLAAYLREQEPRLRRAQIGDAGEGGDPPIRLDLDLPEGELVVAFDREMLYRVIDNLLANAVQAIEERGKLDGAAGAGSGTVRLSLRGGREAGVLEVHDDGPGVPPADRAGVFDPYRTTKKDGTGLGLTIVKKIVIDHGGQIDVHDSPLGGACFRIRLPRGGTSDSEAALAQSELAPLSARG